MAKKATKKTVVLKITGTEFALRTPIMLLAGASNPIFRHRVDIQIEKGGKFIPLVLDYKKIETDFESAFKRIVE